MTEHVPEPAQIVGPSQVSFRLTSPQMIEIEDDMCTTRYEITKPKVPCPGYELKLPNSQSPVTSYPFLCVGVG